MAILFVNSGTAYHLECLEGPRYRGYFDASTRPEQLPDADLRAHRMVVIPCGTPAYRIIPHRDLLRGHLDRGGTIVAMGRCKNETWLPNVRFTPCPTNFWWWLDPDADLGTRIVKPGHPLFSRIGEADICWHLHGYYDVPEGAEVLAVGPGDRPILYVDEVSTRGRMVITSLDPFSHHGRHFMPATTRFLDGFLPWLREIDG